MALSPSRDGSQGVVALWIRGEEQAQRAVELIAALGDPGGRGREGARPAKRAGSVPAGGPMTTLAGRFAPASRGLRGSLTAPADKSISHRAALFAAMASGEARIEGYLRAADTLATLEAVRLLGRGGRDRRRCACSCAASGCAAPGSRAA